MRFNYIKLNFILFSLILFFSIVNIKTARANDEAIDSLELQSKSVVLIESSTGKIIYEKDKDITLNPASITKIMTLILIYEELEKGTFTYDDIVTVSANAASMGGSQVFLEENETQTVKDMIKCISIASANDASVAMAEFIAGSESEFVKKMNEKAKQLGMINTNFINCCGLDTDNHYSSAYDVALMSKELITKYPQITEFTTTWMDTIIHKTKKGESEFGLTNTNKLVRTYNGITGLKTGSTNLAKYCLSASAKRNDIELIAVVMSAPEHKLRYTEAAKLLDYGFANCSLYKSEIYAKDLKKVKVKNGVEDVIDIKIKNQFSYVLTNDENKDMIKYKININELKAPVKKDDIVGSVNFYLKDKEIGKLQLYSKKTIDKATFADYFVKIVNKFVVL